MSRETYKARSKEADLSPVGVNDAVQVIGRRVLLKSTMLTEMATKERSFGLLPVVDECGVVVSKRRESLHADFCMPVVAPNTRFRLGFAVQTLSPMCRHKGGTSALHKSYSHHTEPLCWSRKPKILMSPPHLLILNS